MANGTCQARWNAALGWLRSTDAVLLASAARAILGLLVRVAVHVVLFAGLHAATLTVRASDAPQDAQAPDEVDPDATGLRRKRRGGCPVSCSAAGAGWAADSAYWEACVPAAPDADLPGYVD